MLILAGTNLLFCWIASSSLLAYGICSQVTPDTHLYYMWLSRIGALKLLDWLSPMHVSSISNWTILSRPECRLAGDVWLYNLPSYVIKTTAQRLHGRFVTETESGCHKKMSPALARISSNYKFSWRMCFTDGWDSTDPLCSQWPLEDSPILDWAWGWCQCTRPGRPL